MDYLRLVWLRLRAAWPVNRVVAALTPIIFVPVAGFLATWVASHFPGLPAINPTALAGIFALGAASALAAAYKWLDGWQKHEQNVAIRNSFPPGAGLVSGDVELGHPAYSDIHPDDAVPDVDDLDGEQAKVAESKRVSE